MRGPGRLFRKYALVFAALVGGALIVSGGVELFFSYREEQSALARVQRQQAAVAATRIERFVAEIEQQMEWVLQPAHAVGAVDIEALYHDHLRLLRLVPAVMQVEYIDARGRQQLLVRRLEANVLRGNADLSSEPRFTEARARRGTADPSARSFYSAVTFRRGTDPIMTISRAELGLAGGVTAVELDLRPVYEVIIDIQVGASGHAYVVDASGTLIAHPDLGLIARRAEFADLEQVRTALAPAAGDDALVASDLSGARILTAHQRIDPLGWTVFVEQPLAEAFAPLYASVFRAGVFLVAGIVVAILVSLLLARRMVRPVQALQAGAARIGAGALDERIEIRTGDELEDLASEFNAMGERLRESYSGLERKVEQRTADLAAALDENVRLLDEVREKGRQLEAASRHKSEFLANMSHELRTPLNAIIGFTQVIHEGMAGELSPKQSEYLADVLESAHHLLELINEVLDLSKVEAGRMELEVATFSLRDALEIGVTMVRERAARHGISVSLDIGPDVADMDADERKVKQIVLNLLSNAVKFTPDGGSIGVQARRADGEVRVTIRDTGVGISTEDLPKLFEEFSQVGQGPRQEGTGLGLALTKRFVELHGGRIWVESAVGRGTAFTFALPIQRVLAGASAS